MEKKNSTENITLGGRNLCLPTLQLPLSVTGAAGSISIGIPNSLEEMCLI